jgi:hypothetical protein
LASWLYYPHKMRFFIDGYNSNCMSLYWNGKIVKQFFEKNPKKRTKYRINTDIGRFYFYFEENKNSDQPSISGRLVFFPIFSNIQ